MIYGLLELYFIYYYLEEDIRFWNVGKKDHRFKEKRLLMECYSITGIMSEEFLKAK